MSKLIDPIVMYDLLSGKLVGNEVVKIKRKFSDTYRIYEDQDVVKSINLEKIAYEVEIYSPVKEGKEGGLFFGTSYIYPGKIGNEFNMTKGHYHSKVDTAEFYWCISGEGILLLMDLEGNIATQKMQVGSLHYIPGEMAHRLVNTSHEILTVGACWPSDAGHDYESIESSGFSARVFEVDQAIVIRKDSRT